MNGRCALSMALVVVLGGAAGPCAGESPVSALTRHVSEHRGGRAPWSIDFAELARDRSSLPIGVFDSGIGGLTVLEAILKLDAFDNVTLQPGGDGVPDFAGESFLYLGDQANMPYGNYPARGREEYLRELILKDAVFLLGTRWRDSPAAEPRFDKPPVKAIVIACNTATAYGLEDIRAALRAWGLEMPVIGIIEAGARALVERLPADGEPVSVGVLATVGTCASRAYPRAIGRAAGLAGKPVPRMVQRGSVGLAGAIEGNPAYIWRGKGERGVAYDGPSAEEATAWREVFRWTPADLAESGGLRLNSVFAYAGYEMGSLLESGAPEFGLSPLRYVVLGCTHFPLARSELARVLDEARRYQDGEGKHPYRARLAPEVEFIDPAEHTARELFRELARGRIRAASARGGRAPPAARFYFSVAGPAGTGVKLAADGSLDAGYKVSRRVGRLEDEDTVVVPLTAERLPGEVRTLVESLPAVWAALRGVPESSGAARGSAQARPR